MKITVVDSNLTVEANKNFIKPPVEQAANNNFVSCFQVKQHAATTELLGDAQRKSVCMDDFQMYHMAVNWATGWDKPAPSIVT